MATQCGYDGHDDSCVLPWLQILVHVHRCCSTHTASHGCWQPSGCPGIASSYRAELAHGPSSPHSQVLGDFAQNEC